MATATSNFDGSESPMTESGAWTDGPGGWNSQRKVSGLVCPVSDSVDAASRHTTSFNADQYSQATWAGTPTADHYPGVITRMNSTTDGDAYCLSWDPAAARMKFYRVSDTGTLSWTQVGSDMNFALVAGTTIKLKSEGTNHTCYHNGSEMATIADTNYTSGNVGLSTWEYTPSTNEGWTTWEGGDVAAAAEAIIDPLGAMGFFGI